MAEVADIFRIHGPDSRQKYGAQMLPRHLKAMEDIEPCRTEALGGNIYYCEPCPEHHYSSRSGKHRHGPTCPQDQAQEWLHTQKAVLLPVPHLMVTFTLPDELRRLARSHQQAMSPIRFRRSAAALQELASEPRFVGGTLGMVGVLHTWPRDLHSHPHVHSLVPGGGLSADGQDWLPSRADFLGPVKPRSLRFRATCRAP
jgi:Transposase zinc-binding domain/Putative transposase